MLVILRENVENLGRIGDLVNVSTGFARNYLIPNKLVMAADAANVKMIENQKKVLEKKRVAARATSEGLAKKLADQSVTISRKVGENDKLFGSVTQSDIMEALKKSGHTVEKRMITLEHPIKALGVHTVLVKFDQDVTASVKVLVTKEE
ncbi:MAG: 50S ribosomal protein L9 [Cryobacterium sp.]|nr:50S ribosomal protein L9 [Oligoflexia bacterium]